MTLNKDKQMRWIVSLLGIILSVSAGAASHFVPQLSHSGGLTHAAFSPQGHFIATASEDATVRLWSPQGQIISVLEHPEVVLQTVFLRSEEHTSELQSRPHLVCRLLLEKKKHVHCSLVPGKAQSC